MKSKRPLAAFLLGVGLCFVPALGHGKVEHSAYEFKASYMDVCLLDARVTYMMNNPTNFLMVRLYYDSDGSCRRIWKLPRSVHTKGKIFVWVHDNRDVFSYKSGIALLDIFKRALEVIYSFIHPLATDMDTDIVATFYSGGDIPLGYFYQGEYHLWEE